jgi:hypothetical protein
MFTNTLNFLYFLSPINFMSSYIFNVIIYFYLSPVHIENAFKFPNLILHCQKIYYFLIYFKKKMFVIYFPKLDGARLANRHLLLPHLPKYAPCTQHFPHIHFAPNTSFHLQFNPIFENLLSNLLGKDSVAT